MEDQILNILKRTVERWSGEQSNRIIPMPNSGSDRKYYRIFTGEGTVIGVYNTNKEENKAFVDFTNQFRKLRLNVPEILFDHLEYDAYLIQDLGNTPLLTWVNDQKSEQGFFPEEAIDIYKQVIDELICFQVIGGRELNYEHAYPVDSFDHTSIFWDLNYFKYYFLKPSGVIFNELKLEKDFNKLIEYLLKEDSSYFMFRDFQARNIMLDKFDQPYFIDYQGGRRGPLQYDLASLLYQAKAEIPESIQLQLLQYYLKKVKLLVPVVDDKFYEYFNAFALIRNLQTLGAYGFRGLIQQKQHFKESIPLALKNTETLFEKLRIKSELPELMAVVDKIIEVDFNK